MKKLPEPKITPVLLDEFKQALAGGRGDLDAWLEVNDEAEVRAFVLAIQKQAYEDGLRDAGKDAQRIDWFERKLFVKHWNGVVDSGSQVLWNITANWRHTIQRMTGNDFRAAVDAAMLTASQKESQ